MTSSSNPYVLRRLDLDAPSFITPVKKIESGDHLTFFLTSTAYFDLKVWILQLARACLPVQKDGVVEPRRLDAAIEYSPAVSAVRSLLDALIALIDQAPPDTGPRRFGNVAFRSWMKLVDEQLDGLLLRYIKPIIPPSCDGALCELRAYLLDSFGSSQRLDYGTGHELSYIAFLGALWKLGAFEETEQWSIVAGTLDPYLTLMRRLIMTYTLEPAGSHGVWGLDDHFFIPYILGSAQLAPPFSSPTSQAPFPQTPVEGSIDSAPEPATITSPATVREQKTQNFYFAAIAFILDVKKGPFFEHSPYLYNISGIKDGWGKINKGMLKMYDAEVLGKFPVVQHFSFGQLWKWERHPHAIASKTNSVHIGNQPKPNEQGPTRVSREGVARVTPMTSTRAPWSTTGAGSSPTAMPSTRAPWKDNANASDMPPPRTQRNYR